MPHDHDDNRTATHVLLVEGTVVSHYKILRRIGAGGMGEVYLAEDGRLDRRVALKFLSRRDAADAERRERFVREAKAAARVNHPHIVTVYEVGDYRGRPFFAMELVEGRTLADLLEAAELSPRAAIGYALQVAGALEAVHAAGIVHRDIKPSNVVIDARGEARLLDFGLARSARDEQITRDGTTVGTLGFMSPEQVRGETVEPTSDVYSLGMLCFQLLSGELPFQRDNDGATVHAILHDDLPDLPEEIVSQLPGIDRVIRKMTAREPGDRYADAKSVRLAMVATCPETSLAGSVVEAGSGSSIREHAASDASIAVLPFTNMSADPEQEYFCDGIAEDIINDLTQVPNLRVVARTSAFAFKGKNLDIRHIGRQLNVANVLEGSVRKAGDRVRVTAQLVTVKDGYHLWSERYDRKLDDIFAIQDDISRTIVETLKLKLGGEASGARGGGDVPIEAYDLYSKGRYQLNLRTAEGFRQALRSFEQAIEISRDYGLAFAGLADTYFLIFAYDMMEPREAISRSRHAAQRALELEPRQVEAATTLGGILTYYDWAWEEAEAAFRQALTYGSSYVSANQWYGELLSYLKRSAEAEEHLNKALAADPLATIVHSMFACHYVRVGEPERALPYLERAEELGTDNDATYAWHGFALQMLGRNEEALRKLDEGRRRTDNAPYSTTMYAHAVALMGDIEPARETAAALVRRRSDEYVSEAYLATLYLDLGDEAAGNNWLQQAVRRHNTEIIFMATMPYYANIRAIERAGAVLSVVGLKA